MGGLDVYLGDGQVALDHLHGGMAQDALEGVDVSAIAKECDGKCVPEAMGMAIGDAGALADALDEVAELLAVEVALVDGGEQGRWRL